MNLSKKAMLISLNISQWSARKYDKKVTTKITDDYNAKDAGRFNKMLIAQDAIEAINKIVSEARNFHSINTLPWLDNGTRMLPSANFFQYSSKIKELKDKFQTVVNEFLNNYESYKEEARIRLNGMFQESDYPSVQELSFKFDFETMILPLPDSQDFRVDLNDEMVEDMKAEIEERVQSAQAMATKDLYKRVFDATSRVVERLSQKDGVFRDTLIGNIEELIDILPRLNVADDAKVEELRESLTGLCEHAPEELRSNQSKRAETARKAQDILNNLGFRG